MNNIIRAKLKRLCPYTGPYIPSAVRENAKLMWPTHGGPEKWAGWTWDGGSGFYQCELELYDLDGDHVDPIGYIAIRPMGYSEYALIFLVGIEGLDLAENLIFATMEEAKRFLDGLLAADSPPIPFDTTPGDWA